MFTKNAVGLCIAALVLCACAAGNTYNYESSELVLPIRGQGEEVGVIVVDRRPYVLSGDKPPSFIGLQRGGFGNPFSVKTSSGKALTSEMESALIRGMESSGFKARDIHVADPSDASIDEGVRSAGLDRNVVLVLSEWKTDAMARFALSYDVELRVKDQSAKDLASHSMSGQKETQGAAGFESANSTAASRAFSAKMNLLFGNPEIERALESGD